MSFIDISVIQLLKGGIGAPWRSCPSVLTAGKGVVPLEALLNANAPSREGSSSVAGPAATSTMARQGGFSALESVDC